MKKLSILLILLIPVFTFSQIIHIPADYPTIQQGIDAAVTGDTVLVDTGTYYENLNYNGKNIVLASHFLSTQDPNYIEQTIIDGNQNGSSIVTFENGESQDAVLCGFTITNGYSNSSGGGISCVYNTEPQLKNLVITNNEAQYNGGGIICGAQASPGLMEVTISNNTAGGDGGGLYCFNYCNPDLEDVLIETNTASYHGGGICCLGSSSPALNAVSLAGNTANQGGGIFSAGQSNFSLTNSAVNGNSASDGGGIFMSDNTPVFSEVVISDNSATRGGGIYSENNSVLDLQQSALASNQATSKGAAIYSYNTSLHIDDCTLSENEIEGGQGGALHFSIGVEMDFPPEVYINNSLITNNIGIGTGKTSGMHFYKPEGAHPFDIQILNCSFLGNTSRSTTALRITGVDLGFRIENCSFVNNEAEQYTGAALFSSACSGEMINCLFDSNIANTGEEEWNAGGVTFWGGVEAMVINCTFTGNSAYYGAAMTVMESDVTLLNSIVWDNDISQIALLDGEEDGSVLLIGYCDVQNGDDDIEIQELSEVIWDDGNIESDPGFIDWGDHPRQIGSNSLCIDAGTPDTSGLNLPEEDLAGEVRVFNDRVDIGAYEWNTFVGFDENMNKTSNWKAQSFPNPFTATTTIEYELNHPSTVQLTIYNHFGQQVDFIQQNQSQGKQQMTWDASGLPAGIYFFRMQAGEQVTTGKLLLAR